MLLDTHTLPRGGGNPPLNTVALLAVFAHRISDLGHHRLASAGPGGLYPLLTEGAELMPTDLARVAEPRPHAAGDPVLRAALSRLFPDPDTLRALTSPDPRDPIPPTTLLGQLVGGRMWRDTYGHYQAVTLEHAVARWNLLMDHVGQWEATAELPSVLRVQARRTLGLIV